MAIRYALILIYWILLSGCAGNQILSEEERLQQSQVDTIVSQTLFTHELDTLASYSVHKDGKVVIKFAESVTSHDYTAVVDELRANKDIPSVYAEQSGKEVCGIPIYR